MHRQNIRALSLIVCTFTYLMIGAAVFDALESDADNDHRQLIDKMNEKMQLKYNLTKKDRAVLDFIVYKSIPHKAGAQWRFAGAFYFATVVITTVGYGHSTPATTEGRAFCIFYAMMGIPLNLVMFQSIGERLNTFIGFCLTKVRRWLKIANPKDVSMSQMIMVSNCVGTCVVLLGTYLFNKYENWSYLDSFYYCFITLTTIGFGDFVAMQTKDDLSKNPGYVVFSLLFILFGMAIFAASVNLFVLRFMATNSEGDTCDPDQVKTVVLKELTGSNDTIATPNGSVTLISGGEGKMKEVHRISRRSVDFPSPVYTNMPFAVSSHSGSKLRGEGDGAYCLCQCYRCLFRKHRGGSRGKHHYTIRRGPTRISHLLYPNTVRPEIISQADPSPSETDSFLLYELKKRRPSL